MNKWQENNIDLVEEIRESDDYTIDYPGPWYDSVDRHFQCTECGGYCTYRNFEYYNKDPRTVKCYSCQG